MGFWMRHVRTPTALRVPPGFKEIVVSIDALLAFSRRLIKLLQSRQGSTAVAWGGKALEIAYQHLIKRLIRALAAGFQGFIPALQAPTTDALRLLRYLNLSKTNFRDDPHRLHGVSPGMKSLSTLTTGIRTMAAQLVSLPEVERLSPAVIRILGGNPGKFSLQGTNTYIVGTGPNRLLIDSGQGMPSWIATLKRILTEEKISIKSALLTHWHHDHIDGVPDLLGHSPDTAIYKRDPHQGWLDIEDGQTFEVEGASLKAVHTPGHAIDHMVFVFKEENALFTGDNVLGQGTAVFEDLGTYLRSLEKMGKLVSGRGYPGHGPVLSDVNAKINEYISHRYEREKQVIQTLGSAKAPSDLTNKSTGLNEAWTPTELVKVIYAAYPESLHGPAVGGIVQILQKLQKEDKVLLEDGESWRLKDRSSL
ncbi:putative Metallo-beta-lactamase domain-containing protein [Seiridium unicorne]|uniref:Metallo-beta-lactamase domain-containing protein n=1 Tax=Seiridium unicorne TaxID=138068 RepID=A0ABR2V367_9PEZI